MRVDALREHAGEEESVIANMLAHLTLAIERRGLPENRVGLQQQLTKIFNWFPVGVADPIKVTAVDKLAQQADDVVGNCRVHHPRRGKPWFHQIREEAF